MQTNSTEFAGQDLSKSCRREGCDVWLGARLGRLLGSSYTPVSPSPADIRHDNQNRRTRADVVDVRSLSTLLEKFACGLPAIAHHGPRDVRAPPRFGPACLLTAGAHARRQCAALCSAKQAASLGARQRQRKSRSSTIRLDAGKAVMKHADGIKPLTKEVLARIYPGMRVAPADIRSLHGHVQPPRAGTAWRALGSTFASFTSWRPPRS